MTDRIDLDTKFLLDLLRAVGTSSDETEPANLFRKYLMSYAGDMKYDTMGNTLATANCNGTYNVMLSAHIDEIGMQVTECCDNGLLKLRKVGGVNSLHVIGHEVVIRSGKGVCQGVIVADIVGNNTVPGIDDCFIDICCSNKKEAEQRVDVGDYVTLSPNARIVGDTVVSKAVDNRSGVFVLSQVFHQLSGLLHHVRLSVAATTQEEIGLRGMAVLAQQSTPAICINIDVTDACQINKNQLPVLGNGAVLYRNADSNPVLRRMIESTAQQANIPLQMAVGRNITGGTDSSRIQLFSPKTAVVDLSIPCKYMHTHHEQCSLADINSCVSLLKTFILSIDNQLISAPPLLLTY